jgi:hypothetical protein
LDRGVEIDQQKRRAIVSLGRLLLVMGLLLLLQGADPSADSLRVVISLLSGVGGGQGEAPLILRVPEDYPKIQEAIDAAPDGSIILIGPGEYPESLMITKSLTLQGSGPLETVIVGTEAPLQDTRGAVVYIQGGEILLEIIQVTLRGLTIQASFTESPDVAVRVEGRAEVTLQENHLYGAAGIITFGLLEEVRLSLLRNTIISSVYGIAIGVYTQIFMHGNVIRAQGEGRRIFGLWLIGFSQVLMIEERIEGWQTGISIGASWVSIQESVIEGNRDGIVVASAFSLLELSRSKVINNDRYGVAIEDERCFPELKEVGLPSELPLAIQGGGNIISGNGTADLCPEDYPWPEGFRKP